MTEQSNYGMLKLVNSFEILLPLIVEDLAVLCGVYGKIFLKFKLSFEYFEKKFIIFYSANDTKLICAVGSRNGTEETKLMVLDFDVEGACSKCYS